MLNDAIYAMLIAAFSPTESKIIALLNGNAQTTSFPEEGAGSHSGVNPTHRVIYLLPYR